MLTLFCHRHTPRARYNASLDAHETLPQWSRHGAHAIIACRNLYVLAKVSNLVHRAYYSRGSWSTKINRLAMTFCIEREKENCLPVPKSSKSWPDWAAAFTSFIFTERSDTTNFSGRSGNGLVPDACSLASARTESLVTPGRIIPSRGGVTSSVARMEIEDVNILPATKSALTSICTSENNKDVHSPDLKIFLILNRMERRNPLNLRYVVFWTVQP
jgi:hypothetical protein